MYIHVSERLSGKFDIFGSLLSVAGMVALVYGFINAANHSWSQGTTVTSLTLGVVLLVAFVLYESRSKIAMMPMRIFANRSRAGAYLIMLIIGAAMFGMFYFMTFFIQGVMGFSSLKTGASYLPFSAVIIVGSGIVSSILPKVGPKPLIAIGSALMTVGLFWFAQVKPDTKYLTLVFPAMMVMAVGMAMVFVTLTVVAVTKVTNTDTGLASALLNVGQQIGGSIGLAVLATAFASASKSEGKSQLNHLTGSAQQHLGELLSSSQTGKPAPPAALSDNAAVNAFHAVQAHGSSHGFLIAAMFGIVAVVAAVGLITVKKSDMAQVSETEITEAEAGAIA
jgi:hypothetical protein